MGTTWVCPYHYRHYKDHIICEDGRIELPSIEAAKDYMRSYCGSYNWEHCSLARALNKYYEEKER